MRPFFDTYVLVYRLVTYDPRRAIAQKLIEKGGIVSVQVINEFAHVAHRKLKLAWIDVAAAVTALLTVLPSPLPLTIEMHEAALGLASRYNFAFYDALIVAAALGAECDTLLSEDMQHGMVVMKRLTIRNPFLD